MSAHQRFLTLGVLTAAVAGCYDQILVPGDEENDRIEITNDEIVLEQRVGYPDEEVLIDPSVLPAAFGSYRAVQGMRLAAAEGPSLAPSSIELRLVTEASPPNIDGQVVQATSVWVTGGDKSVVSYNFRGTPAVGALDFFDRLDRDEPRLRSSATFTDADVNAVTIDGNWAYAAMLSSDQALPSSAVVERLRFKGSKFTLEGNVQTPVASFAATSVAVVDKVIYATSGDNGSLYALDEDDLSILAEFPDLDDARWVAWDEDSDRIVVAQGTPGRLSLFEEGNFSGGTLNHLSTFSFPGADVPESKSTVEIAGDLAIIAAGSAGVQIICLDTGAILGTVPRPDPGALGLDPSVVVTNSVTVDDDVMFISNGEAGVYAAAADEDFDKMSCSDPLNIQVLGQLRFDDLQSANHIMYRGGDLYIAAGLGGIKVVEVRIQN